jgi:benzoyl-CoA-dihydrodiol lyase
LTALLPTSKFAESIAARVTQAVSLRGVEFSQLGKESHSTELSVDEASQANSLRYKTGIKLTPLTLTNTADTRDYKYVRVKLNREQRYADLTVRGPDANLPTAPEEIQSLGDDYWPLRAYRELDDALLYLRVNEPEIGLVCLHTAGNSDNILAVDRTLAAHRDHWLIREILLQMARVLRRLDLTAKSFFALIEPGSCFAGNLLELALAADRSYMLNNPDETIALQNSELNAAAFPMSNGLTRLQSRFLAEPQRVEQVLAHPGPFDTEAADAAGLITFAPDDLDWEDEIRLAIEERTSLSPDALTGMEASLRFAGPESMDTKIFGRLTAWQNWIFQRPNAVGPQGALTNYGKPTQSKFDFKRT